MWRIIALVIAAAWLGADYVTKVWADSVLREGPIVVNSWMNFSLAYNKGAAFSFLSNEGGWQRWFFTAIAVVIGLWLLIAILREKLHPLLFIAYGSILGGALGNLYDRLTHGHVIDFIQWHYQGKAWPTFNIADVGICVGVGAMALLWLIELKGKSS